MKKQQSGFTLIELMIVVAIIGILAALAIPTYQDYVIRTQVSEGNTLASGAKTAVTEYYENKGAWPDNNKQAGLAAAGSITGNYVTKVTAAKGVITAAYGGPKANAYLTSEKTLALSAIPHGGSVSWTCKPTGIAPQYLPQICR